MSVYTVVTPPELENFLEQYAIGALVDYQEIRAGIENTNYFLNTTQGSYVLTLFERMPAAGLGYCFNLTAFLAAQGVRCARPVANRGGGYTGALNEKPAAIVERLNGINIDRPDIEHCRAIGAALGHLHNVTKNYPHQREASRNMHWHAGIASQTKPKLSLADADLLDTEIFAQRNVEYKDCARGVIHGDLFRDNVLFVDYSVSGLIDFYDASSGWFIYDLAVTVSDWCFCPSQCFDVAAALALTTAYAEERDVAQAEWNVWLTSMRAVGLRFWLSRLHDLHFPRAGSVTQTKDPDTFKRLLEVCRDDPARIASLLPGTAPTA